MSIFKKLAGETVIYGLSSVLGRVLNFIIMTPYLTRVFLREEYGVVTELYAFAGFLMVMFTYRMETTFFRFSSKKDANLEKSYAISSLSILCTTLMFCAFLIGFSQPIAELLNYPDNQDYVIWFALIIGFDALTAIPFARLRLESKALKFAMIKILNVVVNALMIVFFLEGCPLLIDLGYDWANVIYNAENRIGYVFLANLIASGVTFLILLPSLMKVKLQWDADLWRTMMKYTFPLLLVGLAGIANEVLDRILLMRLLPGDLIERRAQVGIYGACYKFAVLMALFTQAFNYAAEPFFFRNSDRKDSKEIYAKVAQGFTVVACVGFLSILLFIDFAKLAVGSDFHAGIKVVPILLLANLCLGLYYNFSIWYKLTDKTIYGAYISVAGAVITVVLNLLLIPRIGYVGSAWATLACYFTMTLLSYLIGKRYYPVPYPILKIVGYIVLALLIYQMNLVFRGKFGPGTLMLYGSNAVLLGLFLLVTVWPEVRSERPS